MAHTTNNDNTDTESSIEALEAELAEAVAKRDALRGELAEVGSSIDRARDAAGAEVWKIDPREMTISCGIDSRRYALEEQIHPDDVDAFLKTVSRITRDRPEIQAELRIPGCQCARDRFRFRGRAETFDADGRPMILAGVKINIAKDIQVDVPVQKLQTRPGGTFMDGETQTLSEEQFREFLDNSFTVFYWNDLSGKGNIYSNSAVKEYSSPATNQSVEQMEELGFESMHPDDRQGCKAALDQMLSIKADQPATKALTYRRKNIHGEYRWFFDIVTLIPGNDGKFQTMFGSAIDITAQKEAESALRVAEERYRTLINLSSAVIWSCGLDMQGYYFSPSVVNLLGYTPEEMTALRPEEILFPESYTQVVELIRGILEREKKEPGSAIQGYYETCLRHKNGEGVLTEVAVSAKRDDSGRLIGFCGAICDITQFHRMKTALKTSREELENNVLERTKDLARANDCLRLEIERRRLIEKALLEMGESEQRSIGHELHDGLCQQLAGIMCLCEATREHLMEIGSIDAIQMGRIHDLLGTVVRFARYMARLLSPLFIDVEGLCNSLEALAAFSSSMLKVACRFLRSGNCQITNSEQALSLYLIAYSAVYTAIYRGKAEHIDILLETSSKKVSLIISDDGCNRTAAEFPARDYDLRMMEYRIRAMGGSIRIRELPERGVEIKCVAPIIRQKEGGNASID